MIHLESGSNTHCYNNTFEAINFEIADHGAIRILGGFNTSIQAVGLFDNRVISADPIRFGRGESGNPSQSNLVLKLTTGRAEISNAACHNSTLAPKQNAGTSTYHRRRWALSSQGDH